MPEDGFASRPFQPPPPQPAPPPARKSTKLLSIGNLDDVDATLLAGRGPSVRCAAASVPRRFVAIRDWPQLPSGKSDLAALSSRLAAGDGDRL